MNAPTSPFYGWKLLAALWAIMFINLAFPTYGLSVLDTYMASDLHLSRMTLGLTYAAFMSMTGIPAPLAAWCIHRFGIRLTLVGGNLLLVIGAIAMATFVASPTAIVLFAGVIVGTSDAIGGPVPAQASVTLWFVRHRSFALAVLLSGAAVGGFIAAPLLDRIVAHSGLGWRAGWWLIAALGVVACVISMLFVRERPQDLGQAPDGGDTQAKADSRGALGRARARVHVTSDDWSPWEALRSPTFWILMAAALGFSAVLTLFLALGISQFEDLRHSPESAALALSVSVLCGLGANLGVGFLGDRIDPRVLWAVCSALDAVGAFAVLDARSGAEMYVTAALLGIAGSGCMVCIVTLLGNYFGPRAYPAVFGTASAIQSTLGAAAPIVAGYWYDHHGSYRPIFIAGGLLCGAASLALALISPPVLRPKPTGSGGTPTFDIVR